MSKPKRIQRNEKTFHIQGLNIIVVSKQNDLLLFQHASTFQHAEVLNGKWETSTACKELSLPTSGICHVQRVLSQERSLRTTEKDITSITGHRGDLKVLSVPVV